MLVPTEIENYHLETIRVERFKKSVRCACRKIPWIAFKRLTKKEIFSTHRLLQPTKCTKCLGSIIWCYKTNKKAQFKAAKVKQISCPLKTTLNEPTTVLPQCNAIYVILAQEKFTSKNIYRWFSWNSLLNKNHWLNGSSMQTFFSIQMQTTLKAGSYASSFVKYRQ